MACVTTATYITVVLSAEGYEPLSKATSLLTLQSSPTRHSACPLSTFTSNYKLLGHHSLNYITTLWFHIVPTSWQQQFTTATNNLNNLYYWGGHLLWNIEFGVTGFIGQPPKYDGLLSDQIEGVSKSWAGGLQERCETPPLPPTSKQLVQL